MELAVKPRTELGKKVNALRRAGFLPAVIYGEKVPSQPVSVPYADFMKVFREAGESTIFKLKIDGKKEHDVLIYDIKFDPLKGVPQHVDFYAVPEHRAIRHKVPFEFAGEAPAVKNFGGILIKVMHEIEVEALPKDLPHAIEVDLSSLSDLEAKLHVRELVAPKGVEFHGRMDDVVVLIETPRSEEELKAIEETPAVEEVAEVKTEREIKSEEKVKEETEEEVAEK